MFPTEIWYLRYIKYVLINFYKLFYTKFIYILCKFYSVPSFDYT